MYSHTQSRTVRCAAVALAALSASAASQPPTAVAAEAADAVVVSIGGKSLSLADAIRQAASDEQLLAYRELREEHGGTAEGEFQLAMWCRKHELEEEERLHWWTLLALDEEDADAIRALRLQRYQGMLLTADEVAQAKRDEREAKLAAQQWLPRLRRLKQTIEHGDDAERAAALQEIPSISDPTAIPTIERVFPLEDVAITTFMVETVAKMQADAAAEFLARIAVESPDEYARQQAALALESRSLHSYVPLLVARLATPIELDVHVQVEPGGPIEQTFSAYSYTGRMGPAFYNKHRLSGAYTSSDVAAWGPEVAHSVFSGVIGYEPERVTYNYVLTRESADEGSPETLSGSIDATDNSRRAASIEDLQEQIRRENEAAAEINERIHAALVIATRVNPMEGGLQATDQRASVDPRLWWKWWHTQSQSSCSVSAGIDVWTQTGLRPIEQVLPGDRVLTRDPTSGELAFNLVAAVAELPEGAMQAIELGGRTVVTAPEQLFRVADMGWKQAIDLHEGMKIDGLTGAHRVDSVSPSHAIARYSLLVANVSNFFVDQQGVLVHDAARP